MTKEEYKDALINLKPIDFYKDWKENCFPSFDNKEVHMIEIGIIDRFSNYISNYKYRTDDINHSFIDANGFFILGIVEDVLYFKDGDEPKALKPGEMKTYRMEDSSYDYEICAVYLKFD